MNLTFKLSHEPIDLQVSTHINNMFNTYKRYQVMESYDFIRSKLFKVIYNTENTTLLKKLDVALFNMLCYYGESKMNETFEVLFGEKATMPITFINQRSR